MSIGGKGLTVGDRVKDALLSRGESFPKFGEVAVTAFENFGDEGFDVLGGCLAGSFSVAVVVVEAIDEVATGELDKEGLAAGEMDYGVYGVGLVNVGKSCDRVLDEVTGFGVLEVGHAEGFGADEAVTPMIREFVETVGATDEENPARIVLD